MVGLRTSLAGLMALAGVAEATPLPLSLTERVQVFATCAGRFSALTEHQWMTDGPASEATARTRDAFVGLLEAVAPFAADEGMPEAQVMHWRLAAKVAERELLSDALFAEDAGRRQRAGEAAEANVAMCRGLLLQT